MRILKFNESLRDKMLPKSKEEVIDNLKKLDFGPAIRRIVNFNMDYRELYTEEEFEKNIKKLDIDEGVSLLQQLNMDYNDFYDKDEFNNYVNSLDFEDALSFLREIDISPKDVYNKDFFENTLKGYTPHGMLDTLVHFELDDEYKDLFDLANKRIKESEKELDEILNKYPTGKEFGGLVKDIYDWVNKNGGNAVNINTYGLVELSHHLSAYGSDGNGYTSRKIYNKETIDTFKKMLKHIALDETQHNNDEYGDRYY